MAETRKATYLYSRASDYKVVAATGVYGGPTPSGHIRVEFFVDYASNPVKTVHAVTPEGRVGEELEREPTSRSITREFQIGVVFTPDVAESLARWLQDKVAILRQAQEKAAGAKADA